MIITITLVPNQTHSFCYKNTVIVSLCVNNITYILSASSPFKTISTIYGMFYFIP